MSKLFAQQWPLGVALTARRSHLHLVVEVEGEDGPEVYEACWGLKIRTLLRVPRDTMVLRDIGILFITIAGNIDHTRMMREQRDRRQDPQAEDKRDNNTS